MAMKHSLRDYIKVYNIIPKKLCESTLKQLDSLDLWQKHAFYEYRVDKEMALSGDDELDVCHVHSKAMMDLTWKSISNYVTELDFPWFAGWNGHTELRFNRYSNNQTMAIHCDHINSMFDGKTKGIPTLSIVGLLNDDFTGGDFIMFDDEKIPLVQGDIMLFPSNFLYPHLVSPMISGTRNSFVSWVW